MGPNNRLVSTAVIEVKKPHGSPGHQFEVAIYLGPTELRCGVDSAGSGWAPVTLVSTAVIEGKRLLWRPGHRWEDNTKVDLTEIWHGLVSADSGLSPVTNL
jgi:hypothetical protein